MAKNKTKSPFDTDILTLRESIGLSQKEFWEKIGVTQSAGSRHEASNYVPKSIAILIRLVHQCGIDPDNVSGSLEMNTSPVCQVATKTLQQIRKLIDDATYASSSVKAVITSATAAAQREAEHGRHDND